MAEHKPVPWKLGFADSKQCDSAVQEMWITDVNNKPVVWGQGDCCKIGGFQDREDAEFVLLACNAHDDLLAACEAIYRFAWMDPPTFHNVGGRGPKCIVCLVDKGTLHGNRCPIGLAEAAIAKARGGQ